MSKKFIWQDLPKTQNLFTKRNAKMIDLVNDKPIQYYSANTKIAVVQKCVTPEKTYYRTKSAKEIGLDWAFEATAFGLPNEIAPSVPTMNFSQESSPSQAPLGRVKNKKATKAGRSSKDGGKTTPKISSILRRLFRK